MKAVILAAGKGARVQPLTADLPKPMIPILGKPVLEYLIEHLARYGVREIMINVSWQHEKIEDYFGDGRRFGVQIGYSFEGAMENGVVVPRPLGSAGGLRKIQDFGGFFDETTLVICGDALIDLDLKAALFEHRRTGALASLVTKEVPWNQVSNYGVVVTRPSGRIVSFQEKPGMEEARSNLVSTGIYLFEPEIIELIPPACAFDLGSGFFPLLVRRNVPFFAQKRFFNWIDIGRITDYWAVQQRVLAGEVAQMDMPGREVRDGLWVGLNTQLSPHTEIYGPVYIGSNTEIRAGAKIIGPTWIGHGSLIEEGAVVDRSILFEYTRVGADARISEMVLYGDYCINRDGEIWKIGELAGSGIEWGDARAFHAHDAA